MAFNGFRFWSIPCSKCKGDDEESAVGFNLQPVGPGAKEVSQDLLIYGGNNMHVILMLSTFSSCITSINFTSGGSGEIRTETID